LISNDCSCVCKVFLVAALIPSTAFNTSEAASPLSVVEKELLTGLAEEREDAEVEEEEEGGGAISSIEPKADEMSCFTGAAEDEGVGGKGGNVDEAIVEGVEGRTVFVDEMDTAGVIGAETPGVTGAAAAGSTSPGTGGAFKRKFFKLNGKEAGSG
jgi:hypothetical protein